MNFSNRRFPRGRVSLPTNVVLATHNMGKLREFEKLLNGAPLTILPYPSQEEIIEETGSTYHENARLKARYVAKTLGCLALADDSGLEVDALNGEPGVHTARFVSDDSWVNSREILLRLMAVPAHERTARMRAVLCLAWPNGDQLFAEGVIEGTILSWPRGSGGFGVDPIFSIDGMTSLAEWPQEKKNQISHRAQAVENLMRTMDVQGL